MPEFVHCLDLCNLFYHEVVQPVFDSGFPGLPYSAAIIGRGSEVLGFDDEVSSDHDWGPRVILFLDEDDHAQRGDALLQALSQAMPSQSGGYPVCHGIELLTLPGFLLSCLNLDLRDGIEPIDWLTFPEQKLCSITAGAVYHDELGLQALRDQFAYYPHDVWLYLLTAGWARIVQEEHLMGRAGTVGDELGAAIMGSRLVRDLMRLCFLMEKQYAPYPKWFGTAFAKLACGDELLPILRNAQLAKTWKDRERHFGAACERVGAKHNALGITEPVPFTHSSFHDRSYKMCNSGAFGEATRARIKDPDLSRLAFRGLFGSIDQMSDSTNILDNPYWRHALRKLYELASMEHPPDYGRFDS